MHRHKPALSPTPRAARAGSRGEVPKGVRGGRGGGKVGVGQALHIAPIIHVDVGAMAVEEELEAGLSDGAEALASTIASYDGCIVVWIV